MVILLCKICLDIHFVYSAEGLVTCECHPILSDLQRFHTVTESHNSHKNPPPIYNFTKNLVLHPKYELTFPKYANFRCYLVGAQTAYSLSHSLIQHSFQGQF